MKMTEKEFKEKVCSEVNKRVTSELFWYGFLKNMSVEEKLKLLVEIVPKNKYIFYDDRKFEENIDKALWKIIDVFITNSLGSFWESLVDEGDEE
jgi:hypothetical protein